MADYSDALSGAIVDAWGRALQAGADESEAAQVALAAALVPMIETNGPAFTAALLREFAKGLETN